MRWGSRYASTRRVILHICERVTQYHTYGCVSGRGFDAWGHGNRGTRRRGHSYMEGFAFPTRSLTLSSFFQGLDRVGYPLYLSIVVFSTWTGGGRVIRKLPLLWTSPLLSFFVLSFSTLSRPFSNRLVSSSKILSTIRLSSNGSNFVTSINKSTQPLVRMSFKFTTRLASGTTTFSFGGGRLSYLFFLWGEALQHFVVVDDITVVVMVVRVVTPFLDP